MHLRRVSVCGGKVKVAVEVRHGRVSLFARIAPQSSWPLQLLLLLRSVLQTRKPAIAKRPYRRRWLQQSSSKPSPTDGCLTTDAAAAAAAAVAATATAGGGDDAIRRAHPRQHQRDDHQRRPGEICGLHAGGQAAHHQPQRRRGWTNEKNNTAINEKKANSDPRSRRGTRRGSGVAGARVKQHARKKKKKEARDHHPGRTGRDVT